MPITSRQVVYLTKSVSALTKLNHFFACLPNRAFIGHNTNGSLMQWMKENQLILGIEQTKARDREPRYEEHCAFLPSVK